MATAALAQEIWEQHWSISAARQAYDRATGRKGLLGTIPCIGLAVVGDKADLFPSQQKKINKTHLLSGLCYAMPFLQDASPMLFIVFVDWARIIILVNCIVLPQKMIKLLVLILSRWSTLQVLDKSCFRITE